MSNDTDTTIRASPGAAAAQAVPAPADMRNHVQVASDASDHRKVSGD